MLRCTTYSVFFCFILCLDPVPILLNGMLDMWAPFQYLIRRLIVRSRKVSKMRDWQPKFALKFDRHVVSSAANVLVECQSDRTIINTNLAALSLREILTIIRLIGYWNGVPNASIETTPVGASENKGNLGRCWEWTTICTYVWTFHYIQNSVVYWS